MTASIQTTTTLGGVTLASPSSTDRSILSIGSNKTANVFYTPIPTNDAEDALLIDLQGTTKVITINGQLASDPATISTFLASLEAMCNGKQTTRNLVSSYIPNDAGSGSGSPTAYTIAVMVASVQYNWDLLGNRCNYSIQLYVGKGSLRT